MRSGMCLQLHGLGYREARLILDIDLLADKQSFSAAMLREKKRYHGQWKALIYFQVHNRGIE